MARVVYLTTLDNPYSPVDEFVEWFKFDELHGYHTTGYIAALAHTHEGMGEEAESREIEFAIDRIIELHSFGIYKKIVVESSDQDIE